MVSTRTKAKKRFCWFKLLGICLVLFVMLKLNQQYQRYQTIQAELAQYERELVVAIDDYQRLQRQSRLYYDDSYLEQLARSSLGMIKAGEVVISPAELSDALKLNDKVNEKDVLH